MVRLTQEFPGDRQNISDFSIKNSNMVDSICGSSDPEAALRPEMSWKSASDSKQ